MFPQKWVRPTDGKFTVYVAQSAIDTRLTGSFA